MDFSGLMRSKRILIFDGAMGTQLEAHGAPAGGAGNLLAPEIVFEVERAYVEAGSDVLIANSFSLNRIYAETHGIAIDIADASRKGVEIARRAAGETVAVLGGLGPTGQMIKPLGEYTEEQIYDNYVECSKWLADAGADGLILETMMDLKESVIALKACRETTKLPVLVSMTYQSISGGGRTMMGNRAEQCARELEAAGAVAVGANCGTLSPERVATIVTSYRAGCGLPILVEPNAGSPRLVGEEAVFDMTPDDFARGVLTCIQAGATLVGGCCGTSPAHIRALADAVANL